MEIIKIVMADGAPKRGLGANDDVLITGFGGNGSSVNWMYNWYSTTTNKQNFTEYVPMLWGIRPELTGAWDGDASSWIAAGSEHLLAFNEPENAGQSNINPTAAADAYRKYMEPFAGKAQLGAPGVSNDGRDWMTKFLAQCSNCTIDFVPIHWYNPCSLLDDFKTFVSDMCRIAGNRPVWITEFQPQGSDDDKAKFLKGAIAWLDNQQCVARYAYFGTADIDLELLDHGGPALSALGTIYAFTPFGGAK
ncbi:cell wall protein o-glucosyl hydrolase [Diaporthe eres]|nr:cell wall protein o-glucosyl hydrolase [Diaporthe eres]